MTFKILVFRCAVFWVGSSRDGDSVVVWLDIATAPAPPSAGDFVKRSARQTGVLANDLAEVTFMPFELQPRLKGKLLELRPLRPEDFDALYAVASDPLIWEQHPSNDRHKPEIFQKFFR